MTDGTTGGQLHAEWDRVCGRMRTEIGEAAYRSWVAPMTVRGVHDGLARISVPTRFMRFLPSFCFSSSLRLRVTSPP